MKMAANVDVLSFAFSFIVLVGGLIGYLKAGKYNYESIFLQLGIQMNHCTEKCSNIVRTYTFQCEIPQVSHRLKYLWSVYSLFSYKHSAET